MDDIEHRVQNVFDDRAQLLECRFKDTLPSAPLETLSAMRLDGDTNVSTWPTIEALDPELSGRGFWITDDFGSHTRAGQAILDNRSATGIDGEIVDIDGFGASSRTKA